MIQLIGREGPLKKTCRVKEGQNIYCKVDDEEANSTATRTAG